MKVSKNKKWNEIKTSDSWSIFKIMGEFVEGYEKLSAIGPCISIFGSARTKPEDKYYKEKCIDYDEYNTLLNFFDCKYLIEPYINDYGTSIYIKKEDDKLYYTNYLENYILI